MARLTSHTLSALDGTHAGGIGARVTELATGDLLFTGRTDAGGRLAVEIAAERLTPGSDYELAFDTGAYWAEREIGRERPQIVAQVVLRFAMPDPQGSYHLPVILSPNGYSVWWSS